MDLQRILKLLTGVTVMIVMLVIGMFTTVVLMRTQPQLFEVTAPPLPEDWSPRNIHTDLPKGKKGDEIRYGYLLIAESSLWMGPEALDENQRYAGNNLACKNCHLQNGTQAGSASWVGVTNRFPQFRGRENKIGTIEDRINGCMERSMNGSAIPVDSREMKAIVAYMEWLSEDVPEERVEEFKGFPKLKIPAIAADPVQGKVVYEAECQLCHGEDGQGIRLSDATKGYQYPPLWGADTYNHGAGMHRVLTAAEFIKGNMPFGQASLDNPKLTDEQAYHVAAYINSFDRPQKSEAEADFPDRKLKPVSTPYGPWADEFTAEQHKYGPFQPIMAYYESTYGVKKFK